MTPYIALEEPNFFVVLALLISLLHVLLYLYIELDGQSEDDEHSESRPLHIFHLHRPREEQQEPRTIQLGSEPILKTRPLTTDDINRLPFMRGTLSKLIQGELLEHRERLRRLEENMRNDGNDPDNHDDDSGDCPHGADIKRLYNYVEWMELSLNHIWDQLRLHGQPRFYAGDFAYQAPLRTQPIFHNLWSDYSDMSSGYVDVSSPGHPRGRWEPQYRKGAGSWTPPVTSSPHGRPNITRMPAAAGQRSGQLRDSSHGRRRGRRRYTWSDSAEQEAEHGGREREVDRNRDALPDESSSSVEREDVQMVNESSIDQTRTVQADATSVDAGADMIQSQKTEDCEVIEPHCNLSCKTCGQKHTQGEASTKSKGKGQVNNEN